MAVGFYTLCPVKHKSWQRNCRENIFVSLGSYVKEFHFALVKDGTLLAVVSKVTPSINGNCL